MRPLANFYIRASNKFDSFLFSSRFCVAAMTQLLLPSMVSNYVKLDSEVQEQVCKMSFQAESFFQYRLPFQAERHTSKGFEIN